MTVKELIERLKNVDENLEVFGYSILDEGGDRLGGPVVRTSFPYCQADPPDDLPEQFVLLSC